MDFYNVIRCYQTTVQITVELDLLLLLLLLGTQQPNNEHQSHKLQELYH